MPDGDPKQIDTGLSIFRPRTALSIERQGTAMFLTTREGIEYILYSLAGKCGNLESKLNHNVEGILHDTKEGRLHPLRSASVRILLETFGERPQTAELPVIPVADSKTPVKRITDLAILTYEKEAQERLKLAFDILIRKRLEEKMTKVSFNISLNSILNVSRIRYEGPIALTALDESLRGLAQDELKKIIRELPSHLRQRLGLTSLDLENNVELISIRNLVSDILTKSSRLAHFLRNTNDDKLRFRQKEFAEEQAIREADDLVNLLHTAESIISGQEDLLLTQKTIKSAKQVPRDQFVNILLKNTGREKGKHNHFKGLHIYESFQYLLQSNRDELPDIFYDIRRVIAEKLEIRIINVDLEDYDE